MTPCGSLAFLYAGSMTRVFNFSPGRATLPEPDLRQAAEERLDWRGSGMSVMEMSHRGNEFMSIHAETEAALRELMVIPANRLDHLVRANPALAIALIRDLAAQLVAAEDRLREDGKK